jgi:hypothetical protein
LVAFEAAGTYFFFGVETRSDMEKEFSGLEHVARARLLRLDDSLRSWGAGSCSLATVGKMKLSVRKS